MDKAAAVQRTDLSVKYAIESTFMTGMLTYTKVVNYMYFRFTSVTRILIKYVCNNEWFYQWLTGFVTAIVKFYNSRSRRIV